MQHLHLLCQFIAFAVGQVFSYDHSSKSNATTFVAPSFTCGNGQCPSTTSNIQHRLVLQIQIQEAPHHLPGRRVVSGSKRHFRLNDDIQPRSWLWVERCSHHDASFDVNRLVFRFPLGIPILGFHKTGFSISRSPWTPVRQSRSCIPRSSHSDSRAKATSPFSESSNIEKPQPFKYANGDLSSRQDRIEHKFKAQRSDRFLHAVSAFPQQRRWQGSPRH